MNAIVIVHSGKPMCQEKLNILIGELASIISSEQKIQIQDVKIDSVTFDGVSLAQLIAANSVGIIGGFQTEKEASEQQLTAAIKYIDDLIGEQPDTINFQAALGAHLTMHRYNERLNSSIKILASYARSAKEEAIYFKTHPTEKQMVSQYYQGTVPTFCKALIAAYGL